MRQKNIKKSKELGSPLSFDIQSSDLEVDTDGGDVGHFVLFIYIAKEDVGFTNGSITDYY